MRMIARLATSPATSASTSSRRRSVSAHSRSNVARDRRSPVTGAPSAAPRARVEAPPVPPASERSTSRDGPTPSERLRVSPSRVAERLVDHVVHANLTELGRHRSEEFAESRGGRRSKLAPRDVP